jgi:CheY-like chemotaxis protein
LVPLARHAFQKADHGHGLAKPRRAAHGVARSTRMEGERMGLRRILLAEDEVLVRELAFEDLTDAGFEVVAARNGDAALAVLQDDRGFDLLFTDIRMPGMLDGWELAAEAKRLVPGIKVLYSTGLDESDNGLGPTDRLIVKPYRLEALLGVIEELQAL